MMSLFTFLEEETLAQKAETGDTESQYKLGMKILKTGISQTSEEPKTELGIEWLQKAAENGHPRAMYNLGIAFQTGQGVEINYEKAFFYYRESANTPGELPEGMHNLALCYFKGIGVEKSLSRATYWYKKAAENGLAIAMNKLALCYHLGRGISQDFGLAAEWYLKSARNGYNLAKMNLLNLLRDSGIARSRLVDISIGL